MTLKTYAIATPMEMSVHMFGCIARIERTPYPKTAEGDFSFRLRLLDFPRHFIDGDAQARRLPKRLRKLIDAVRVSSVILFKVGYRDTIVSGRVAGLRVAHLVTLEWILGFLVLAAFTVTLSKTQPLINRLVSGVL